MSAGGGCIILGDIEIKRGTYEVSRNTRRNVCIVKNISKYNKHR